jgi:hypothetical protein
MPLSYPVRNYRCPFCGTRMKPEEYRGFYPWKCPGCSKELQFAARRNYIVQLISFGGALLLLYLLGVSGWQLFVGTVVVGVLLVLIFVGPLERLLPAPLEAYAPPPWREKKITTLFPQNGNSDETEDGQASGVVKHSERERDGR